MAEDRTPKAAVTRQAPRKTGLLRHIARGLMALVATLMVIAIVGFWIVGNYVAGKIFPFAGTGSTVSDEIVSITLAMGECETAIKVEKAYLIFRKNWSGGRQEFVEMAITYPEMTPWSVYARSREVSDAEKLRKKNIFYYTSCEAIGGHARSSQEMECLICRRAVWIEEV